MTGRDDPVGQARGGSAGGGPVTGFSRRSGWGRRRGRGVVGDFGDGSFPRGWWSSRGIPTHQSRREWDGTGVFGTNEARAHRESTVSTGRHSGAVGRPVTTLRGRPTGPDLRVSDPGPPRRVGPRLYLLPTRVGLGLGRSGLYVGGRRVSFDSGTGRYRLFRPGVLPRRVVVPR